MSAIKDKRTCRSNFESGRLTLNGHADLVLFVPHERGNVPEFRGLTDSVPVFSQGVTNEFA